jgi:Fe-S cluster assembly protein SufD
MERVLNHSIQKWLDATLTYDTIKHQNHDAIEDALSGMEFPNSKMEDWKYTRTQKLNQGQWILQGSEVNSDPEFQAISLVSTKIRPCFFGCLNQAAVTDAFSLVIAPNESFNEPFHFVIKSNNDGAWTQPSFELTLGENASAKVVLHFIGKLNGFCNALLDVTMMEGSHLDLDIIQDNDDSFFQILDIRVDEASKSHCNVLTHTLNGGWTRNNLWMSLNGEHAHAALSGFYLPQDGQLIDNHTVVDHRVPNCTSNELYKGVLYDKSRGVFNGKVFVRKDAQKTEAYQSNKNIMMSDDATMDSKPELEIYADDVRCSHGSTTGQFDEEALFYLRARGLSALGAKQLLVSAYVNEVINRSNNADVVTFVKQELSARGRIIADEV